MGKIAIIVELKSLDFKDRRSSSLIFKEKVRIDVNLFFHQYFQK